MGLDRNKSVRVLCRVYPNAGLQQQPDNTKTLFINTKQTKGAAGGECAEHKRKTGAEGN